MQKERYILSLIAGIGLALLTWYLLIISMPRPDNTSVIRLLPTIVSGIVGGISVAVIAPKNKLALASGLGLVVGGVLVALIAFSGRFPLLDRNPIFWYWPAWLIPAFTFGGLIGSKLKITYNTYEPPGSQ